MCKRTKELNQPNFYLLKFFILKANSTLSNLCYKTLQIGTVELEASKEIKTKTKCNGLYKTSLFDI